MRIRASAQEFVKWFLSMKPCWMPVIFILASCYFKNVSCSTSATSWISSSPPPPTKDRLPSLLASNGEDNWIKSCRSSRGSIIVDLGNQRAKFASAVGRFERIKTLGSNVGTKATAILRPIRRSVDNVLENYHRPNILGRFNATSLHMSNATARASVVTADDYREHQMEPQQIVITADFASILRLLFIIAKMSATVSSAFVGTLRLLAPMIVARRAILSLSEIIMDYMRGRYFRSTYSRLERAYLRYYEAPAAMRAIARSIAQILIFLWLSMMMSWLTGVATTTNNDYFSSRVSFLEGFLWIASVVGSGHAFTQYVAKWGGPLRIQTQLHVQEHTQRTILQKVFIQPFHIIQFMQDPAQWINLFSVPSQKPQQQQIAFIPNPLIFPITWGPLRILQMLALAHIMCTTNTATSQKDLMRLFLIQLALGDEWCRVFLEEKRIGLGIVTVMCYMFSLIVFLTSAFSINIERSYWLLPSVVACFVSGWLNVVIFWNRMEGKKKDAFEAKIRKALLKALTLKPPVY
mmetsp:Transcript_20035/g.28508  ORF Transcript_20035/g.28508 Transcript_20035/m.28508 type:complete len:521 (-) Transcript_20035:236-1798(-)|eukprot:CAMPEP_0172430128 /NCGR_PEP_ID=MMETSP1064-20121228/53216_1 /TAXON_ID=202472 /ORGANISM="Aulacoseira subarctica , Strain CCAP 1002/5" /LENGTH=520 /DNA_ID=CAMNT_0013175977 /DNA_START=38 /DNA_END=1600 /DNA_ORIENTATION=-